jgi:translation elongation factor EF-G
MTATVKVYPDPESREVVTVNVSNCEVAGIGKPAGGKGGGAAAASSKGAGGGGGGGLGSEAAAAARQGIQDALMRGPAAGMPVIGVVAELLSVDAGEGVVINPGMLRVASTRAASAAMAAASPAKMHPLMSVEVTVSRSHRPSPRRVESATALKPW